MFSGEIVQVEITFMLTTLTAALVFKINSPRLTPVTISNFLTQQAFSGRETALV